jgi:phosphate starvation-inducible PhoH-like protein
MKLQVKLHDQLTEKQIQFIRSKETHALLTGPPGTAKTYTALAKGLILLDRGLYSKIIIIRSAVTTRPIGYLPGTLDEKQEVYAEPYIALANEMLQGKQNWSTLVRSKLVEFTTTSHLRGVTFDNAYVILDEVQNLNYHECRTAATRVGEGTALIVCGDAAQSDLMGVEARDHVRFLQIFSSMDDVLSIVFTNEDIVRSGFVKDYINVEEEMQKGRVAPSARQCTCSASNPPQPNGPLRTFDSLY